jgi:uncharacterized Zn-binding protein involved in type VI secretion
MPGAVRVGDPNTAGGLMLNGATSVLINGRPAAYLGSKYSPHPCCGAKGCPPTHCKGSVMLGSSSVTVEGKPLTYVGAPDLCGHTRARGSTDVVVGQ